MKTGPKLLILAGLYIIMGAIQPLIAILFGFSSLAIADWRKGQI